MEQLSAFLRAAPDFEYSVVQNTHKIITGIHELTFEWKKCVVQLASTRSITCLINLLSSESGSSADYSDVYSVGFGAVEGETEEEMATKRSVGTPGPQGPQEQNVFLRADLNILLDDDREHHRGQPNPHLRAIRAVPQVPHGEGRQGHPSQQSGEHTLLDLCLWRFIDEFVPFEC
ncbi:hypothetical protein TRIUR3_28917 [Triticum urartu]|uniref:Uncharacterized protein n=1 Tax=Triticum urartu TaxID=4572 RepID=M8AEL1_TRIUA|nr:hypothetical protein TRIUR3_28917 [Triticum urartu]